MSWKLDNIDFKTYGVGVVKSSGVLDMPRIVDVSTDWIDRNGKDYWQDAAAVKYQDREITLNCWIKASGYEDFKTKVAAFYAALVAPGERTLITSFGHSIAHVTVQQSIQMLRKHQYVSSLQIGVFTLRLSVSGDTQTKLITVYNSIGEVRGVFKYRSDAKLTQRLMNEDSVSFELERNSREFIGRGDYVLVDGVKYIQFEGHDLKKIAGNKYLQRHTFDSEFFRMRYVQFRVNDVSNSYLWSDMEGMLDQIILNMDRHFPGKFVKGTVASTISINHQFQDETCLGILSRLSETYELEFDYTVTGDVITVNVVSQVGNLTGTHVNYGKDNELISISASAGNTDKMVTHLFAYGSDKNIPLGYRSGKTRLELPVMPLVKDFYGFIVEKSIVWDDIKPERIGTVTDYAYTAPLSIDEPETAKYEMSDSTMFDLKEIVAGTSTYMIPGTTAKIHFNSGELAGFDFEVLDYTHSTKTFLLTPLKQANGQFYPDSILYPHAGDEYVLLDIKLPQLYIDAAETRLQARAQEHIDRFYQPLGTYQIEVHPKASLSVKIGDVIFLDDADFTSETDPLRVSERIKNLYTGQQNLSISQIVRLSNRKLIEKKIAKIEQVLSSVPISEANDQRNSTQTVGELSNKIINPLSNQLRTDALIKSGTIDARMLDEDAQGPQFSFEGMIFDLNYLDDVNKINVTSGKLRCHNWSPNTLRREGIDQYEAINGEGSYNPTREWNYSGEVLTLADSSGYYIYAKVPVDEFDDTVELFASVDYLRPKRYYPNFVMYMVCYINPPASPRTGIFWWGNVRYNSHAPVTIVAESAAVAKIDPVTQVLTLNPTIQALSGTTITMNVNDGLKATLTLTGNTDLTITNLVDGLEGLIEVVNGSTAYTLNIIGSTGYTTEKVMGNNTAINSTVSSHTTVVYWRTGSTLYYGFIYDN